MRLVFLSCDSLDGFVVDEDIVVKELESQGHTVTTLSWRADVDWSAFDCAIIRTTWDYMECPEEFFLKLEMISRKTKLMNSLSTVKWNIHKGYLKTFQEKGVTIVPTFFFKDTKALILPEDWNYERVVVKPSISAGSFKTFVYEIKDINSGRYREALHPGDWMCQPFLPQIKDGETSLIYFNKVFSHALLKVPKTGEFRVQEEFGGDIIPLVPSVELLDLGDKIISLVQEDLLYARVDLIPFNGHYALMEIELIEPALYFRTNKNASTNFIKALLNKSSSAQKS
jgi:glutathione synthase/RimK-type ligase-like ATP-grasp enzyme